MLKKIFILMMASAVLSMGIMSCSDNDSDNSNDTDLDSKISSSSTSYTAYYGSYFTGSDSSDSLVSLLVLEDSAVVFSGDTSVTYSSVSWTEEDSSWLLECRSDSSDADAAASVTFTSSDDGVTALYDDVSLTQVNMEAVSGENVFWGIDSSSLSSVFLTVTSADLNSDASAYTGSAEVSIQTASTTTEILQSYSGTYSATPSSEEADTYVMTLTDTESGESVSLTVTIDSSEALSLSASEVNADLKKVEGEYTITASLSCYVNAMGGVEFGEKVYKDTSIVKFTDGTYYADVGLGTGTVTIYTVTCDVFVDPRNSVPGYYSDDSVVRTFYTISDEGETAEPPSTDEDAESGVRYVTSMVLPVDTETSEYNVWLYINSNVMGVQFCDGTGSSSSNHPDESTPYVGKVTLDWTTLAAAE
ncbi:hypothetical protein [Treponema sp.]|uniref:hypothetical protein n=1 Tax=Treponema sp. TaxID=166 RepID=UPI0025E9DC04|nr:hypothetical protein [Treponema sp.]MCR5217093.1 hypothetical protein [Treponema sp.]